MKKVDIVAFARDNGAFSSYSPDDLQYIGDNAQAGAEITYHELLFEDVYGYIRTWSFRVAIPTGKKPEYMAPRRPNTRPCIDISAFS